MNSGPSDVLTRGSVAAMRLRERVLLTLPAGPHASGVDARPAWPWRSLATLAPLAQREHDREGARDAHARSAARRPGHYRSVGHQCQTSVHGTPSLRLATGRARPGSDND